MSTYAKKFLITKHLLGKKKLQKYHLLVSGVIGVLKMSLHVPFLMTYKYHHHHNMKVAIAQSAGVCIV